MFEGVLIGCFQLKVCEHVLSQTFRDASLLLYAIEERETVIYRHALYDQVGHEVREARFIEWVIPSTGVQTEGKVEEGLVFRVLNQQHFDLVG